MVAAKKLLSKNIILGSGNVTKASWKVVRDELGIRPKSDIFPILDERLVSDLAEVANSFNKYFLNVANTSLGPKDWVSGVQNRERPWAVDRGRPSCI